MLAVEGVVACRQAVGCAWWATLESRSMATSQALDAWRNERASELDRVESVHKLVTGAARGRRWDSEHLNCAIISRLLSEFQGFARDLLTDSVDHIVSGFSIADPGLASMTRAAYLRGCGLSTGNPTWNALDADFGRCDVKLRVALDARYPTRGPQWRNKLERAIYARNAIAHADDVKLVTCRNRHDLTLRRAREWRSALDGFATGLDAVVGAHLKTMTGTDPW